MKGKGFLSGAAKVLEQAAKPLHYKEITSMALSQGLIKTKGSTPWATLNARISSTILRDGEKSKFIRTGPGVFGLRSWIDKGTLGSQEILEAQTGRAFVPGYPIYGNTRAVLPAWVGATRSEITGMKAAVFALRGTPQKTENWTDPDTWIDARLSGEHLKWARRTWDGSGKKVNPRYTQGNWLLASNFDLLTDDSDGRLTLSDRGKNFIAHNEGRVVQEIDNHQGLDKILELIGSLGPSSKADLLEPWKEHLLTVSRIRADSSAKAHLWQRLRNLLARRYIERTGREYGITNEGLRYLELLGGHGPADEPIRRIRRSLKEQQDKVRSSINDLLSEIDPFAFEHLIKQLLEVMGYDDVEVTSATNDKGVDVIGEIQVGITSVKEVIQVKRHKARIQRPVVDALRGALHRFSAVRGTIITTGDFSKGTREAAFEPGAAPITLISGEKLIDLLAENDIGVTKRKLELWELDEAVFTQFDAPEEAD